MENPERVFTLKEATEALGELRPLVEELQGEWTTVKTLNPKIQKAREKAHMDAFSPHGVDYVESVSHVMLLMSQIRDMGVLVKDLDKGLCDFPFMKEDRVVYLCWHLGEDAIGYWHDVEAGFGGREPLDGEEQ